MIVKATDHKIRRSFSQSAGRYEALTAFQAKIGDELLKGLVSGPAPSSVLDIGMGTGRLAHGICRMFPRARVYGLDFAAGMVAYARGTYPAVTPVLADAREIPFRSEAFDLLVSNLAYQWVYDLPQALAEGRRVLRPGGKFHLSLLGRETLQELYESWGQGRHPRLGRQDSFTPVARFLPRDELESALRDAGFSGCRIREEMVRVKFIDFLDLLKWLKETGANASQRTTLAGKTRLRQAREYYHRSFTEGEGVYASFQVLWAAAQKPDHKKSGRTT